jgi:hypothetical protein
MTVDMIIGMMNRYDERRYDDDRRYDERRYDEHIYNDYHEHKNNRGSW